MPYADKNKEREYRKQYREKHKKKLKKYAEENREHLNEYRKEWRQNNKEKNKKSQSRYYSSVKGRYNAAKHAAQQRNKSFTLTIEEYESIVSQPCYYCKNNLGKEITTGSGLDRLDNSVGYESHNVRSCCWVCNKIKNDSLTSDETLVAVKAIIEYRNSITCA